MSKTQDRRIWDPAMECMSRDERHTLQGIRLRETVRRVYDAVPLYRQRMDEKGVVPEDIRSAEDLRLLPFTEKTDLRDQFPYGLLAVPLKQIVRIQGSSGTTGKPIVVGYTQHDVDVWTELTARAITAAGAGPEDIMQICYGYGLFTGGLGVHQGASRIGCTVVPMSSGNTQRQLLMLRELGATVLCCTPSYAIHLGETARDMGLIPGKDLRLRCGCFGAEPWSEEMRVYLEELLGIDACDIYGLTEIAGPGVAFECLEKHGMHVNEDHVMVEIIDPATGEPVPDGESGEMVFTTITKEGMPMLRYRTHDICRILKGDCACGRTTRRLGRITGRTDDMLVIRGVNVFPSQIESVLVGIAGVAPHFLMVVDRVHSADTLEVQVEMTESMFSDTVAQIVEMEKRIGAELHSVIGIQAKVRLVAPRSIPRSEGKTKHIVDNRKL